MVVPSTGQTCGCYKKYSAYFWRDPDREKPGRYFNRKVSGQVCLTILKETIPLRKNSQNTGRGTMAGRRTTAAFTIMFIFFMIIHSMLIALGWHGFLLGILHFLTAGSFHIRFHIAGNRPLWQNRKACQNEKQYE